MLIDRVWEAAGAGRGDENAADELQPPIRLGQILNMTAALQTPDIQQTALAANWWWGCVSEVAPA